MSSSQLFSPKPSENHHPDLVRQCRQQRVGLPDLGDCLELKREPDPNQERHPGAHLLPWGTDSVLMRLDGSVPVIERR